MKYYKIKIGEVERDLPICPINESLQIAGFVIVGDPELSEACAEELIKKLPEFDYIMTAEAKGIPLAHDIMRKLGNKRYVCARKAPKLYMQGHIEVEVRSITTRGIQKLFLDKAEADMICGKRLLIVDDVVSTGESLHALEVLAEKAGANVVGKAAILAEGDAADRDDLISLQKLPLFDSEGNII